MRFDLAALVPPTRRRSKAFALLPIIQPSISMELAYLAQLRKLEKALASGYRDIIVPALNRTAVTGDAAIVTDADESAFEALRRMMNAMVRSVSGAVRELLNLESKRHTDTFMRDARKAFGIDLSGVVTEEQLGAQLEAIALRNASLIQSFSDDMVKFVQQETLKTVLNGTGQKALAKTLKDQLAISDNRARLIAADQTGKLTADLNRIRQQQAGIDEYIWRTSHDERVRERHRAIDGKRYKWGEPTGAEGGAAPGQPIRCRCSAQAVIVFGEGADAKEYQTMETTPPTTGAR